MLLSADYSVLFGVNFLNEMVTFTLVLKNDSIEFYYYSMFKPKR